MDATTQLQYDLGSFAISIFGLMVLVLFIGLCAYCVGMVRSKNTTTILASFFITITVVPVGFLFVGEHIIYGNVHALNTLFGFLGNLFPQQQTVNPSQIQPYCTLMAVFYHTLLPCIGLAIIIGITAERLKLWAFGLFAAVYTLLLYPVQAAWLWGNGFLQQLGFIDKSGAGLIFLSAAVAGLVGSVLLRPRQGKYTGRSNQKPLFAANLPMLMLGVLFILLGSFGFNAGVHTINATLYPMDVLARIFLHLLASASMTSLIVLILTRMFYGKTDITLMSNGYLAGLAAIAASPASGSLSSIFLLSFILASLVLTSIKIFEKLHIDDPMGFISVFGTASIIGLIATAFTHNAPDHHEFWLAIGRQLSGIGVIILWSGGISLLAWSLIHFIIGLRVPKEEEERGLDMLECGLEAYPEFTRKLD